MAVNSMTNAKLVGLSVALAFVAVTLQTGRAISADAVPARMEIKSLQKIWDQSPHNAFTSLVRYNGKWYCAFRESDAHVIGPAAVRVLVSDDGQRWKSAAVLREEGLDARDPHLSVTPKNELMLLSARATQSGKKRTFQTVVRFSKNGRKWSEPVAVGDPEFWLWSATWRDGTSYAIGYKYAEPYQSRLYRSEDGRRFDTLVDDLGIRKYPNESSIVFDNDNTAYCLLRCSGPAQFGTSKPPYKDWKWIDTGISVGGPALLKLPDGKWIAAGRKYSKPGAHTVLWWLDPATARLTEALALPSGGDTSYPGLAWHDGLLWVSYYSAHEGKCNIYVAKVAIDGAGTVGANMNPGNQTEPLPTDEQVARFTKSRALLASDPWELARNNFLHQPLALWERAG
jgi:hypothetical protein